ncbi:FKBP-type peptidyl-prolyl cis-trans isomerase [Formosa agariphila KMM 3901]|uniref:Peptidyl-prolyl cis-trans isomerase n=2 Tax=Formosa TaxID=225842 RepID=T2KMR5_FORAG|nr:FKBP-type peptidyl-prolyl cis-trans isomerase [Formosa agariphila KMM 3901]
MALLVVFFVSCSSDDSIKDYSLENEQEIEAYIAANNLDAIGTGSGLYYVIDEVGSGAEITATSDITVTYVGMYTDGTVFETQDTPVSFNLQQVIPGWQEGLPYFNEGGSGQLIIPAHLAYGSNDYNGIPGGSVLVFDIEIVDYVAENEQEIVDYIEANNLNAQPTGSGLYYVIDEQGDGEKPTADSNVTVTYKGYFTDGEVFDESPSEISFYLNNVIEGWQEGIQLFNEGGSGTLLIPSHLGYGRYGASIIPGGSVLIFDVNLISVN